MEILGFLKTSHNNCSGNSSGYGDSYSYGGGNGNGGYSNGNGNGYGRGNSNGTGGYSYSYGNGNVNGYGRGNSNGIGYDKNSSNYYGNGYGDSNGNGDDSNGNVNGYGRGNGNGYGRGNGNGDGDGNHSSYGYSGIKSINGDKVYTIDGVNTIIKSIKGNIAKGFILRNDLTLVPCYIVKNDYFFAHGDTIKAALKSLQEKTDLNLPIPQRIINFKNQFHDFNVKIKAQVLYDWHFKLTGSCKTGRDTFCINNNINIEKDKFTVNEFIALTKDSYKGEIIELLKS